MVLHWFSSYQKRWSTNDDESRHIFKPCAIHFDCLHSPKNIGYFLYRSTNVECTENLRLFSTRIQCSIRVRCLIAHSNVASKCFCYLFSLGDLSEIRTRFYRNWKNALLTYLKCFHYLCETKRIINDHCFSFDYNHTVSDSNQTLLDFITTIFGFLLNLMEFPH